ncbi:ankyrin repeat protein [Ilyonectria robusta]
MDPSECFDDIRQHIDWMERLNANRRRIESKISPAVAPVLIQQNLAPDDDDLPALPPRLPRPEYVVTAKLISPDQSELRFYDACEQGLMDRVESFVQEGNPSQAVLQYGLEQASFGNQPVVARYLLEQGAILHDNVLLRSWSHAPTVYGNKPKNVTIFDRDREDPLPLVKVLLDFGWHPNQLWNGLYAVNNIDKVPLLESLSNKPLLTTLLSHGADPNLSRLNVGIYDRRPLDRRCGRVLNAAVGQGDPELVALLLAHGAQPSYAHPLHSLVQWMGSRHDGFSPGKPFSQRRAMAEYLLSADVAGVNDVKNVEFFDIIHRPPRREDMTPFAYACAAQDREYAEWLLEKGADPDLVDGKAFQPMFGLEPYNGKSDPEVVRKWMENSGTHNPQ